MRYSPESLSIERPTKPEGCGEGEGGAAATAERAALAAASFCTQKCTSVLCFIKMHIYVAIRDGSIPKFQPIPILEFSCQPISILIPILEFPNYF